MRSLSLLLLCLACACLAVPAVDFFPGRSGDIVVELSKTPAQDSVILFKGEQISTTSLSSLEDTHFADLFAHVMGTPSFHAYADRQGFPTSSLFNKPKAAVIVALDFIGAEMLHKYPSLSFTSGAHAAAITSSSFPLSSISILANLATGTTPVAHGIVGPSWRNSETGELIAAYSSPYGLSYSANVADTLAQQWNGRSLIVSASASSSLASVFAVHPTLASQHAGWAAHSYSLSEEGFTSRYESSPCDPIFALSSEELLALEDVTVNVDGETVTFKASEDRTLVAELAFVRNLIAKLKSNTLVNDEAPDMYAVVFASLKDVMRKYGKDSTAMAGALTLVDSAVTDLLAALDELYAGHVATTIIAPHPRTASHEVAGRQVKEIVYHKVARLLYSTDDFAAHYPAIYVRRSELPSYARELTCDNLQDALGSDATVHCLLSRLPTRDVYEFDLDDADNTTGNGTNPYAALDTARVWAFWLNFWVALIIGLFVLWGVYCLAYVGIDASKDSLLYRATGRSHPH